MFSFHFSGKKKHNKNKEELSENTFFVFLKTVVKNSFQKHEPNKQALYISLPHNWHVLLVAGQFPRKIEDTAGKDHTRLKVVVGGHTHLNLKGGGRTLVLLRPTTVQGAAARARSGVVVVVVKVRGGSRAEARKTITQQGKQ